MTLLGVLSFVLYFSFRAPLTYLSRAFIGFIGRASTRTTLVVGPLFMIKIGFGGRSWKTG